jgi:type I restriction enzyme S subunit
VSWQNTTVEAAFEFVRNGKSVQQDKSGAGLPITRIETISKCRIDPNRVGFAGLYEAGNETWLLEKGDILFSHINSVEHIGKCAVYEGTPEKLIHGMNLLAMRPKADILDAKFAYYALSRSEFRKSQSQFVNKAVNQASISTTNLKSLQFPLPPIDEQRRIAAILDQADDLRRKRREAMDRLNQLPSAVIDELFDTENALTEVRLDELIRSDDRINYGVVQPGPDVEDGIPLIRVENVVDEDFSRSALKHISPHIEAQYSRSRLRGDEVLVACVGSIGAIALAHPDKKGLNIARAVARIPVDPKKAERVFVAEHLRRSKTQAYFKSETRVVAQPTLNIKQLCETRLLVPPLAVQLDFAARVVEIGKLKTSHRDHLAKLDALFASLLHRAFRDEL